MGNWAMFVAGTGVHHNQDCPADADKQFKAFVDQLKTSGQTVEHASMTYGARQTEDSNYTSLAVKAFEPSKIDGKVIGWYLTLTDGSRVWLSAEDAPTPK